MNARAHRGRVRLALLAIAAAVAVGAGLLAEATGALDRLEADSVDARFTIRGERPVPESVAVVGIDDKTFGELDVQFPFSRTLHARVIDRLRQAGAKVIAYDVQFSEFAEREAEDLALLEASERARNLVFGVSEVGDQGEPNIIFNDETLEGAQASVGNGNVIPGSDGVVRQFPYSIDGLSSFATVAARKFGAPVDKGDFRYDGQAWIDFAGPRPVKTVSFVDVLRGRPAALAGLRGRIVVVGATAPTLKDIFPTSAGGGQVPGPEVWAASMATILEGFPLRETNWWFDVLLILAAGLVAPVGCIWLLGWRSLLPPILFIAAFATAAQIAFNDGRIAPVVPVVLAAVLGGAGALAANYITESRERQRVREVFARFVPAQVADEVIERAGGDLRLGGVRIEGTVMFTDLRGFTAAAESLEAEEVIEVLNRYLTEMSEAILGHGGTLVSYMGDGIMAVFGAPIEQEDHADRALATAREMLDVRLPRFNAWIRQQGIASEDFRMGVGLNTGPFMSGNVGSEQRLEYTAVGDTTNTASRLEGMTKGTPHMLFVADATRAALHDADGGLADVGEMEVRGRKAAMRVWTQAPAGDAEAAAGATPDASPQA